jgi:hypothetical protein
VTFDSLFAGGLAAGRPAPVPASECEAIANEFTKLILAQRPIEASADGATSAEQNLKTVVNLKQ